MNFLIKKLILKTPSLFNWVIRYPNGDIDMFADNREFKLKKWEIVKHGSVRKLEKEGYRFIKIMIRDKDEIKRIREKIMKQFLDDEYIVSRFFEIYNTEMSPFFHDVLKVAEENKESYYSLTEK